jgi:hypothetical protein
MLKSGEPLSSKRPGIQASPRGILSSTSIFLLKRNDPKEFKEESTHEKIA